MKSDVGVRVFRCRGVRRLAGSPPRRPDRRLQGGAGGVSGETSKCRHPVHQKQVGQAAVEGTFKVWRFSFVECRCIF